MFKNAWEQRLNQSKSVTNELKQQVVKIESDTNQLLDRIVSTTNERVIEAYEKRISNLEKEKRIMEEKLTKTQPKAGRFDEMFELAMTFLSSPWKLWESGQIHCKEQSFDWPLPSVWPTAEKQDFEPLNWPYRSSS